MYDKKYRDLPAEIRMIIWKIALENNFLPELIVKDVGDIGAPMIEYHEPFPYNPAMKADVPTQSGLAVLRLDRTTRSEAMACLPKKTILDLSSLKEPNEMSAFLDYVPAWLPCIANQLIVGRSLITRRFSGQIAGGSLVESQRLGLIIEKMVPLDRLVFFIDACRWIDDQETHQRIKQSFRYEHNLAILWTTQDTSMLAAQLEGGTVREVKLFISQPPRAPDDLYDPFVDNLDFGEQVQVEKIVTPVLTTVRAGSGEWILNVSEDLRYDSLAEFMHARFTVVTLSKL